jgi:hypothetical protein
MDVIAHTRLGDAHHTTIVKQLKLRSALRAVLHAGASLVRTGLCSFVKLRQASRQFVSVSPVGVQSKWLGI